MTLKKTIEQHKYTILFCLILVFGSILRLAQLGKVPGGYQMDEAYGAFNAYSLFHSGIDSIPERENHQLTEFIGMDYAGQAVPFESEWIEWKENDRILLCSDGLYDMCTSEMILKCLTMSGDVEKATHELFEMAMSFGGKDNITVIVLQLTDKKIA